MYDWIRYLVPNRRKRLALVTCALLMVSSLLCGFIFEWFVRFSLQKLFPVDDMVNFEIVENFGDHLQDDLLNYITDTGVYDNIPVQMQANLNGTIYDQMELEDMSNETPGKSIVQIIMDRLFE